jgi:hypothetical protein
MRGDYLPGGLFLWMLLQIARLVLPRLDAVVVSMSPSCLLREPTCLSNDVNICP